LYALFWAQAPWIVFGTGGFSFRYLAPLLPIMLVPIGFFLENNKSALLRKCFFALLVISLVVNAVAALSPLLVNNAPWKPLELLLGLLH
jgi:hypothetical protein